MLRTRWIVAGLVVVALGACKKDEKVGDKPADKPADKPSEPAVKPAEPAKPVEAPDGPPTVALEGLNVDDLALLPMDSELVMGVDMAQLQTSALWKEFLAERLISGDVKTTIEELKSKCNLDAMQLVKTATVGIRGMSNDQREGAIIVHGLDKAKTTACADKIKADKNAKVDVTQEGDVTILKSKSNNKSLAIRFLKDDTALAVFGSKATAEGVKAIASAAGGGLKNSRRFADMYQKINTKQAAWMLMRGNSKAFDGLAKVGLKARAMFGSLDVSSGVALDMRIRLDSADQATQGGIMVKQQMAGLATMLKLDKADASSDGEDIKMSVAVAAANLGAAVKQMKALAGMAGGGGGGTGGP